MGFRIFLHAVTLVFNHIGPALRISALLYFVPAIALQAAAVMTSAPSGDPQAMIGSAWSILFLILSVIAGLWIAVAWHRYVLLDEMPGAFLPVFHSDRVIGYFGYSVLVGLVAIGVSFLALVPAGLATPAIIQAGGAATPVLFLLVLFATYFVAAVFAYRVSLVLPASAVNKPMKLGESWFKTTGASRTIFALAFISALCVVVLELPTNWLAGNLGLWAGALWQLLVAWIELLVGVSIITTLYGHYAEGRTIT